MSTRRGATKLAVATCRAADLQEQKIRFSLVTTFRKPPPVPYFNSTHLAFQIMDRDGCHYRRPASVLAAIPFVEDLPNPHTVLPAPPPGTPGSDANYPVDYPSYKFDAAPYIPAHIMPIVQEVEPSMYCLSEDTVRAWTRPSWGWVGFRADYSRHSEEEWESVRKRVWERYKFQHYQEMDKFRILWVEDRERFEGKGLSEIRK